jgi:hypothetical protein
MGCSSYVCLQYAASQLSASRDRLALDVFCRCGTQHSWLGYSKSTAETSGRFIYDDIGCTLSLLKDAQSPERFSTVTGYIQYHQLYRLLLLLLVRLCYMNNRCLPVAAAADTASVTCYSVILLFVIMLFFCRASLPMQQAYQQPNASVVAAAAAQQQQEQLDQQEQEAAAAAAAAAATQEQEQGQLGLIEMSQQVRPGAGVFICQFKNQFRFNLGDLSAQSLLVVVDSC